MPPDPPSISMLHMLIVLRTIYTIAINQDPPLQNSGSAPDMHTYDNSGHGDDDGKVNYVAS